MASAELIDTHVHLVDFCQRGDPAARFVAAMGDARIDAAVVFGMPVKKRWDRKEPNPPGYYLDDPAECRYYSFTDQLVREQVEPLDRPDRLAPSVCGCDPSDLLAVDHVVHLFDTWDGWRGIGELFIRHGELTSQIRSETPKADDDSVVRLAGLAAKRSVPLQLHHNAGADGQGDEAYLPELEHLMEVVACDVVWCHAGVRRSGDDGHLRRLEEMLTGSPHLHVELSWSALDAALDGPRTDEWCELVSSHPERFVLGSDTIGRADGLLAWAERAHELLAQLPADAADAVGGGNARRLWWGED